MGKPQEIGDEAELVQPSENLESETLEATDKTKWAKFRRDRYELVLRIARIHLADRDTEAKELKDVKVNSIRLMNCPQQNNSFDCGLFAIMNLYQSIQHIASAQIL